MQCFLTVKTRVLVSELVNGKLNERRSLVKEMVTYRDTTHLNPQLANMKINQDYLSINNPNVKRNIDQTCCKTKI